MDLKGWGVAVVWPLGCWSVVNLLQFVPMLSSTCGCREQLVLFLLLVISIPGYKLRRVKWQSCLTRSQACSANDAEIADGAGFVLSFPSLVLR